MGRSGRGLLFLVVLVVVFWLVWSRVRIVFFVGISLPVLIGLVLAVTLVIFLLLDYLIARIARR